jgi:quinol monooxygenase YgiN
VSLFGTEVSFRLGPGTLEEARALSARLAAAAAGCRRHVLFVDEDAGEYGCLAEWDDRDAAAGFAARPPVREVLADLGARTGKDPRVRLYAMEETPPDPP